MSLGVHAALFLPSAPAVSISANVLFSASSVDFATGEGDRYSIRYGDLSVELGGIDGTHLVMEGVSSCGDKLHAQVEFRLITQQIQNIANPDFRHRLQSLQKSAHRNLTWMKSMGMVIVGLVILSMVALWLSSDWLIGQAVSQIPVTWEKELGNLAVDRMISSMSKIQSGKDLETLMIIRDRLLEHVAVGEYDFKIYLVDKDELNAMAFPGGNIVIYSGLLKASSSVEEVVGVMAHEIQHVLHRHSLRRMGRSLGMSAVISMIFGDLGGLGQIADLAVGVKLLSHDREQEREADRGAVELLLKAKVNPEPFGLFFKKLEEKETAIDKAFSWLSTHPASAERSEQVRKLYEKSPDWQKFEPLQLEWDKN